MQPIYLDDSGSPRFKCNAIIRKLTHDKVINLNKIDFESFPVEDVEQFFQLLGYSTSGYGDISFVRPATIDEADARAEVLLEEKKNHVD